MRDEKEKSVSNEVIKTINPTTGEMLNTYESQCWQDLELVLDRASQSQGLWSRTTIDERASVLTAVAKAFSSKREELARLITQEMGKPIVESRAEIDKCAVTCAFYAENATAFLSPEHTETRADDSWVSYEPLGTILAVMPWNFPFWQAVRFLAPALVAGNATILKHSPNTSGCALALCDILIDAGLPSGLFAAILVAEAEVPSVTQRLIEDDRIAAVTATGSERAGAAIGAAAGRSIKKSVLELGGSDPFVVLDDADLSATVALAVRSRFMNAGQSCIAAKRFIIADSIFDLFSELFSAAVKELKVGDPLEELTEIGPMARADLVDVIDRQVAASVALGAKVLVGGHRIKGPGNFYAPTVLSDVTLEMAVCEEETFGPVAVLLRATDDNDAVNIANATRWGLGASVWTTDLCRGRLVAAQLNSGAVFINAIVVSDPRLPFGGIRKSGYGRELSSQGIREFVNVRTWWLEDRPARVAVAPTE